MHCSATADRQTGDSSLLFGLSGTGKTTLSADPKRHLIGDDEHCWSDDGIFNIEGGCYAKAINLTPRERAGHLPGPALRRGAGERRARRGRPHVDFTDTSITENTRGAYPIEFIRNAKIPCVAGHPTDVIFLTCDAFGVLPPVSRLTPAQAMYHFISGYTAKVAGTEVGVTEPSATFSACFGGPFLVWHPSKYAELLADEDEAAQGPRLAGEHRLERRRRTASASGSSSRTPARSSTRSTAARSPTRGPSATPSSASTWSRECPGVPAGNPDPDATPGPTPRRYEAAAKRLADLFRNNFKAYESGAGPEIKAAGPA